MFHNIRTFAWSACYTAVLAILLSAAVPQKLDAWCNINGSPACNALLSPCPWYCHYYNAWQEFYSPDCPDVPTCVQGFCLITAPDYASGHCLYWCYLAEYTYCANTVWASNVQPSHGSVS
jgi:hypothetical protein